MSTYLCRLLGHCFLYPLDWRTGCFVPGHLEVRRWCFLVLDRTGYTLKVYCLCLVGSEHLVGSDCYLKVCCLNLVGFDYSPVVGYNPVGLYQECSSSASTPR